MRFGGFAAVISAALLLVVTGCTAGAGAPAESDEIGTQSSPITFVTRKDLPVCNDATASLYAYIESEDLEVGCLAGTWQAPAEAN